jgi:hypothetical protein
MGFFHPRLSESYDLIRGKYLLTPGNTVEDEGGDEG